MAYFRNTTLNCNMKSQIIIFFAFRLCTVCLLLVLNTSLALGTEGTQISLDGSDLPMENSSPTGQDSYFDDAALLNFDRQEELIKNQTLCDTKKDRAIESVLGNGSCYSSDLQKSFDKANPQSRHFSTAGVRAHFGSGNNVTVLTESFDDCEGHADYNSNVDCKNKTWAKHSIVNNISSSELTLKSDSVSQNVFINKSNSKRTEIRIWDKGVLKRDLLNTILTYFRRAITVPVFISLVCVALTVAVFKDKNFRYHAKPMVISFNIFEGLKCIAYLLFRMMKLYVGDSRITWNSTYAKFFIYYVTWFPLALGRIGILHNALITLDRFFTIAFPIRRLNKRLVTRPKTCVAVIVASMFVYQIAPVIIFFVNVEPLLDYKNTFSSDEIISEIYVTNPAAFRTYSLHLTIGHALFAYIPLFVALVFNTLTIVSLWQHERTRTALTTKYLSPSSGPLANTQKVKRQTNTMIVVSSLVFAVLVFFRRVLPLVSLLTPHFGQGRREMHLYLLINEILIFFDCVSPLANLISYTTLSSQFRRRLKKITLPAIWLNKDKNDHNSNICATVS